MSAACADGASEAGMVIIAPNAMANVRARRARRAALGRSTIVTLLSRRPFCTSSIALVALAAFFSPSQLIGEQPDIGARCLSRVQQPLRLVEIAIFLDQVKRG
jgi:hypothetical protein